MNAIASLISLIERSREGIGNFRDPYMGDGFARLPLAKFGIIPVFETINDGLWEILNRG
jgi:hypothetical protein